MKPVFVSNCTDVAWQASTCSSMNECPPAAKCRYKLRIKIPVKILGLCYKRLIILHFKARHETVLYFAPLPPYTYAVDAPITLVPLYLEIHVRGYIP
jgi:hypothetical protein